MEDTRDYLEKSQDIAENALGERLSPEELGEKFVLFGAAKRAEILNDWDKDPANFEDISSLDPNALRRALNRQTFRSNLKATHKRLLKVKR